MKYLLLFLIALKASKAQFEDNFSCPDEFEGYYPHLFSCDRYWKCDEGKASLETCGNGLAFVDQDPTFTSEGTIHKPRGLIFGYIVPLPLCGHFY